MDTGVYDRTNHFDHSDNGEKQSVLFILAVGHPAEIVCGIMEDDQSQT